MRIAIEIADVLGLDALKADTIDGAKVRLELRLPGVRVVVEAMGEEVATEHTDGTIELRATAREVSTIIESGR